MSYIPGGGIKKPLNALENPIYPDIKATLPRFVWSKKHWTVDVGQTLRDKEDDVQRYENAVLSQARDYNETIYGKSSHRDFVNLNFRPPLLRREDILPLSRLPRENVVPHLNPGTDNESSGYLAKNVDLSGVAKTLTDRVKKGEWRPTYDMPLITDDQREQILPDLQYNIPITESSAGYQFLPISTPTMISPVELSEKTNLQLLPSYEYPFTQDNHLEPKNIQLDYNKPLVEGFSGINIPIDLPPNLKPDISLSNNITTKLISYKQIPYDVNKLHNTEKNLHKKLETDITPINPAPDLDVIGIQELDKKKIFIKKNLKVDYNNYKDYNYKEENSRSKIPHFRQKLQVKTHGRVNANGFPTKDNLNNNFVIDIKLKNN